MRTLGFLVGVMVGGSALAGEVPPWAEMQLAILVEPDKAKIQALVDSGVDVNAPIGCGAFAPLDGAIHRQDPGLVDFLISLGAWPTDAQMVAAAFGADHGTALKIVMSLHKAGASVDAKVAAGGDKARFTTPLHQAVWRRNTELVSYLLKQGAGSLDLEDVDGFTPLMIAVEKGWEEIVDLLLEAGADPGVKNQNGVDAAGVSDNVIELQKRLGAKVRRAGVKAER